MENKLLYKRLCTVEKFLDSFRVVVGKLKEIIDIFSPLDNPHKGLYHYFYANRTINYGSHGQDVSIIPGLK
jgi:hypothetical protein